MYGQSELVIAHFEGFDGAPSERSRYGSLTTTYSISLLTSLFTLGALARLARSDDVPGEVPAVIRR